MDRASSSLWRRPCDRPTSLLPCARLFCVPIHYVIFPPSGFQRIFSSGFAQNWNTENADHGILMMSRGLIREWAILVSFLLLWWSLLHFNWRWREHFSRRLSLFKSLWVTRDWLQRLRWSKRLGQKYNAGNKRGFNEPCVSTHKHFCFMTFRFYYQTADNGENLFSVTFSSGSMSKAETRSIKRNLRRILESDALIKYLDTWRYALFPQVQTLQIAAEAKMNSTHRLSAGRKMLNLLTRKSVVGVSSQSAQ